MNKLQELFHQYGQQESQATSFRKGIEISDIEQSRVMNEASVAMKTFLCKDGLGHEEEISPLCRTYANIAVLAAHLGKLFKIKDSSGEPEAAEEDMSLKDLVV